MEAKTINDEKKFLIDYANLKQNIIINQKNFADEKTLKNILDKPQLGIPLVLPANTKFFEFKKKNIFKLEKKIIQKKLFRTQNKNYTPYKNFFSFGEFFVSEPKLKLKYKKEVNKIIKINKEIIDKIKYLKKNGKTIGAFQSRNIPHLGHEQLIKKLLEKCDVVFINPVCGAKKKGDVKTEILKKAYNFLIKKHYGEKLVFAPLYASMFYAGPREAIHHLLLRQSLGFDYFIVGRDHAGAENNYKDLAAINMIKKYNKKFQIKVILCKGAYFCNKCDDIVVVSDNKKSHNCDLKNLTGISGTNFRSHILSKKIFKYARPDLQRYIHNLKGRIFY